MAAVDFVQGSIVSVEDLVQEIFIEVWKSAGRYDADRASEATFIATIARRTLWLADAYYVGIPAYVDALRRAAADGGDENVGK